MRDDNRKFDHLETASRATFEPDIPYNGQVQFISIGVGEQMKFSMQTNQVEAVTKSILSIPCKNARR